MAEIEASATTGATPIPSMWRTELLHPPIVHFPIALLTVAAAIECLSVVLAKYRASLRSTNLLLLVLGVISVWLAVVTGDSAHSIINRQICDPTVTGEHEEWGERTAIIFTAVLIFSAFRFWLVRHRVVAMARERILNLIIVILSILGCASLSWTGHLGASLVYQQGAGVYRTSDDCHEFE